MTNMSSAYFFPAILAAAEVGASLRLADIVIDEDDVVDYMTDDQDFYWKYLAYALFSREAKHQLHTLKLELMDFGPRQIEMIRATVSAPDPLAQCYEIDERDEPPRQLTTSRFLMIDPASLVSAHIFSSDSRTASSNDAWVFTTKNPGPYVSSFLLNIKTTRAGPY